MNTVIHSVCDLTVDGFGGEITLNGRSELIDKYIDCIFVIQRRNSLVGRSYDRIFLRVSEWENKNDEIDI